MANKKASESTSFQAEHGYGEEARNTRTFSPNPASNFLEVPEIFDPESIEIEIVSLTGTVIKNLPINNFKVDISDLARGAYFIITYSDEKKYKQLFIKQ